MKTTAKIIADSLSKEGARITTIDPVLAAFGRSWNDGLRNDDERNQLKQYIPLLPGTAQSQELSNVRAWMAIDWVIRTHTATWLDLSPATAEHAAALRALAPITSESELAQAQLALDQAQRAAAAAARAARAAAWDASRAAAWDAARAAARAAVWDAVWDDVRAAAWAATWDAARAAVWAAAQQRLEPTVIELQVSAHDLYHRMIIAGELTA